MDISSSFSDDCNTMLRISPDGSRQETPMQHCSPLSGQPTAKKGWSPVKPKMMNQLI